VIKPRPLVLALAVVLASRALGFAQTIGPSELPPAKTDAIDTAVTAEMARQSIPGLTVAVGQAGVIRFSRGYGAADLENNVPAKSATVYRLASVSKPMTAVAVLQLAERGAIDLDTPVWKYVPAFPEKPWPVTVRQLLGHLGGVRRYREDEPTNTRAYASTLDGLAFFKDDPLAVQPGTRFLYSTYGYNLLGAAVEMVAGKPYIDYLREHVFTPAGMTTTRVDAVGQIIPNRAQGYVLLASGEVNNSALADVSYKVPGGGLCATADDVARFGLALLGGDLLKKETLGQMLTSQKTASGSSTSYGLGLNVAAPSGKPREAWHTGGQERVSTLLYLQPDTGLVIVVLTNLEKASLTPFARRLADLLQAETTIGKAAAR
jgi:CubicO group peptidase (beta-lactamase class C family)